MSLVGGGSTGLKDRINQFRDRRAARIAARFDEEPDSWITVNGNHIPLNEEGEAIGGQQKALGKTMSVEEADKIVSKFGYSGEIHVLKSREHDYASYIRDCESELTDTEYYSEEERADIAKRMNDAKSELDGIQKEISQYNEAVNTKFPTYDDCKTSEDVALKIGASGNLRGFAKAVYMEDADVQVARDIGNSLDDFCKKNPEAKGNIGNIIIDSDMPENSYGACDGWGTVRFNQRYMKNLNLLKRSYQEDVDCKFAPEGTDYRHIFYHELTHQLEHNIIDKGRDNGVRFSSVVMKKVSKNLGMTVEECQTAVSLYSKENSVKGKYAEWFAEAYAEYLTSEKPRKVAAEVGKVVGEELKKRGIRK